MKKTSPIHGPKSSKGLPVRGASKTIQGHKSNSAHKADTRQVPSPTMGNRGPGSAAAQSLYRDEAQRLKAEAKIPGNLGYKQPVDTSKVTHRDNQKSKKVK